MQRPDQSVYAQQLEEHRLKQQREAETGHETESAVRHEPAPAPRAEEPVRQEPVHERVEPQRVEAPREEAPRYEAPRAEAPRQEAPRVDPKEVLSSAGLQMVETDSSKARQPAPAPEPVQLGRPRREKPATPPAASEDLVQVETRNK
jgi:hypothetical protein